MNFESQTTSNFDRYAKQLANVFMSAQDFATCCMAVGILYALPYKVKKSNYPSILHPILSISDLAQNYPHLILHPILHPALQKA